MCRHIDLGVILTVVESFKTVRSKGQLGWGGVKGVFGDKTIEKWYLIKTDESLKYINLSVSCMRTQTEENKLYYKHSK